MTAHISFMGKVAGCLFVTSVTLVLMGLTVASIKILILLKEQKNDN